MCSKNGTRRKSNAPKNRRRLPPQGSAGKQNAGFRRTKRIPRAKASNSARWRRRNPSRRCPWRNSPRHFGTPSNSAHHPRERRAAAHPAGEKFKGGRHQTRDARNARRRARRRTAGGIQHRTHPEERLVGSIFKGKVRNLEDGLKAAFVDIGFEKNAFLHYGTLCRNQFDSGVESLKRPPVAGPPGPRYTKGHPSALSARQRNHCAGDQRVHRHQRPAHHDQLVLPGRYLVLLRIPTRAAFRARLKTRRNASG